MDSMERRAKAMYELMRKENEINYGVKQKSISNTNKNYNNWAILSDNIEPISIIISAYDAQNFIEECLDSIENQTYFKNNNQYEILIGIDGCEKTLIKLNSIKYKYRNLHIYEMAKNCGPYLTFNTLLNLVKYENLIIFGADDIMMPEMVNEIILHKNQSDILRIGFNSFNINHLNEKQINPNIIAADGVIFTTIKIINEIAGGFMPWRCAADSELLARLKHKVTQSSLLKPCFLRRIHDKSLTQAKESNFSSNLRTEYAKQIKSFYSDNEIKIQKECNIIVNNNYNINRLSTNTHKKDYVFNQFFGIGDILFIEPIMRKYFQDGHRIILPVLSKFLNLNSYFPYINFIDKDLYNINYEEKNIIEEDNRIIIPMRWSREFYNSPSIYTMKNKYKMMNMDLDEWRKLTWIRHRHKEKRLKQLLNINENEKFNLINKNYHTFNNGIREIVVNNNYRNVYMDFIDGYTLLDWAEIVESAATIHTVNTSLMFLLETLDLSTDDINIYSRNNNGADFKQTEYLFKKNYIKHK